MDRICNVIVPNFMAECGEREATGPRMRPYGSRPRRCGRVVDGELTRLGGFRIDRPAEIRRRVAARLSGRL